jgi:FkbM family methyltransferase
MFQALLRLRDQGFAPTGILDVGAYRGNFSRGVRQIFPDAYIMMIDGLSENALLLEGVAQELGNADRVIAVLGDNEMEATTFFVVNARIGADLNQTGSSKFKEDSAFPIEERMVPQSTLGSVVTKSGRTFQFLKLDVQGAEIEVLRGLGSRLAEIDVILMEISLVDYNRGAPIVAAMLAEMDKMGFVMFDIAEERRDRQQRLLQIDGVFLRPTSRFRPRPPFWT